MDNPISHLTEDDWRELTTISIEIENYTGKLAEYSGEKVQSDGTIVLGSTTLATPLNQLMDYFYSHDLVVAFDWGHWVEGKAIFARKADDKFNDVSLEDTLKLFTAIMRNDRFNEGAWGRLFESGDGISLLRRLLTFNPYKIA
jgi:hypothetical protein